MPTAVNDRAPALPATARITSSGELLRLVIYDPWFGWLHELSELVVWIDEALDADEPPNGLEAERLIGQARDLIAPNEAGKGFAKRYFEALQRTFAGDCEVACGY